MATRPVLFLDAQFDLAALARQKGVRRKQIVFKPIRPKMWFEDTLRRLIYRVLLELDKALPDLLIAADTLRDGMTKDASLASIVSALRSAFSQATELARLPIDSLFSQEARRYDEKWIDQVNSVIGVDLAAVVNSSDVAPAIQLATQTNVALIKGLTDDVAKRIELAILDLVPRGASKKEISLALREISAFSKKRADLIALDQTSSFNSSLNEIRLRQAGVTSYIWRTVLDRRVRASHAAREGQTFRWDSPPSDGAPGRAIRCRCTASGILDLDIVPKSNRQRASEAGLAAVAKALGL